MSEWKTIESAPKDGSWFMAYRTKAPIGSRDRILIVRWHDEFDDFIWPDDIFDIYEDDIDEKKLDGESFLYSPYEACGSLSHWMPLPAKP